MLVIRHKTIFTLDIVVIPKTAPAGPPTRPPRNVGNATVAESFNGPITETEIAPEFDNSSNNFCIN